MFGKLIVVHFVVCAVALVTVSCSREALIDPDGSKVVTSGNEHASSDYRIDADADGSARNIIVVSYNEYDRLCFMESVPSVSELEKNLSPDQMQELNEEGHVRITDADACIAIALKMSFDLSCECLASVTAIELMNGSWSCVKSCYELDDPILRAACLKKCEDKDPNQE